MKNTRTGSRFTTPLALAVVMLQPLAATGSEDVLDVTPFDRSVWEQARDNGVLYRAIGNDANWALEVIDSKSSIEFISEAGTSNYSYPSRGPEFNREAKTMTYMAASDGSGPMTVVVREQFCQHSKTGKEFGTTVTIRRGGDVHVGCGMYLDYLFPDWPLYNAAK